MPVPDPMWDSDNNAKETAGSQHHFFQRGQPISWSPASENDRDKLKNKIEEHLQHAKKNKFTTEARGKASAIV